MIRIVLIDEQVMVREGMLLVLEAIPGMAVLDGVSSCKEALSLEPDTDPDVVIIDADGDEEDVFTSVRTLRCKWPRIRVIIVLRALRDAILARAPLSGVDGIVTTSDSVDTLHAAIEAVVQGRRFHSTSVWCRSVELASLGTSPQRSATSALTTREFQVLFHLAVGKTIKGTARAMGLSPRTIENHKSRVMKRLNIHSGIELVRFAAREGLIVP